MSKKERKKAVKHTIQERKEILEQKLKDLTLVALFREVNTVMKDKSLSISQRAEKVKSMFAEKKEEQKPVEQTTQTEQPKQ